MPPFRRTRRFAPLIAIVLMAVVVATVLAAAGDLDTTFDGDGIVTTDFGSDDGAVDVAIQADGKIVAAGSSGGKFALARYNSDGSLDTTFGTGGLVTTAFASDSGGGAVAIQSDGKIVHAGIKFAGVDNFALARYNIDGSLDTTFGTGGLVTTNMGFAAAHDVAIQADGKIVAVGTDDVRFALARYNSDGSLDTTFDGDGKVFTAMGTVGVAAFGLAIQSDGKILAAGDSDGNFALARYNSDGSLDTTFDGDGLVTTAFASDSGGGAVAIQSDGKIVHAGIKFAGVDNFALARYNIDGSLDTTFGTGGLVTTEMGSEPAHNVAIQADGKIVALGGSFALARYNSDGSLDTTFGTGGKVFTAMGTEAFGLAIQSDGKIVTAGKSDGNFALARYDAAAPTATPVPGVSSLSLAIMAGLLVAATLWAFRRQRQLTKP